MTLKWLEAPAPQLWLSGMLGLSARRPLHGPGPCESWASWKPCLSGQKAAARASSFGAAFHSSLVLTEARVQPVAIAPAAAFPNSV